jgi:hypothetical protein
MARKQTRLAHKTSSICDVIERIYRWLIASLEAEKCMFLQVVVPGFGFWQY